ncbi:MAG: nucleotidyltransferase domain-containing protein [Candidatus Woesearchaeota archaeon]
MVNKYEFELTNLQQKILELLFKRAGTSLNQNQIAKHLNVSQAAVKKALPGLEKTNFIKLEKNKETKRWEITLNTNNHKVMQLKRVNNLKQVYESGLADFLEKEFAGGTIILFGSYSRGEDIFNSDLDIAIIGRKEKYLDLKEYEKILERKINLNFYSSFDKIHKNLKENLANGIVLEGGFEL